MASGDPQTSYDRRLVPFTPKDRSSHPTPAAATGVAANTSINSAITNGAGCRRTADPPSAGLRA
jgi:hypothetical protein